MPALLLLFAVPQPADATCSAGYYGTCTPNPLVRADDNTITLTDYAVASDRSTFLVCPSDAPYLCGIVFFHQTPTPYGGMWGIKLSCCVNAGDGNPTTQPVKGQGSAFWSSFGASAGQTVTTFEFMPGYAIQGIGAFNFFYVFNIQGQEGGIGYQSCPTGSTLGGFQFQSSLPAAIPLVFDNVYGICRRACTTQCTACTPGTYAYTAGATACSPLCAPGLYVNAVNGACLRPEQCGAGYAYAQGGSYMSADPFKTPTSNNAMVCPLAAPFPCSASVYNAYTGYALGCCASLGSTQVQQTVTSGFVSGAPIASASFIAGSLFRWASYPSVLAAYDVAGPLLYAVGLSGNLATFTSTYTCQTQYQLPAGRWTDSATAKDIAVCFVFCQPCAPGSAYDGLSTVAPVNVCTACASGSYALGSAATACTVCDAGTYTASTSVACQSCAAGTYAATAGLSACTRCQPGYYVASTGAANCIPCARRLYMGHTGATSCYGPILDMPAWYQGGWMVPGPFVTGLTAPINAPCSTGYYPAMYTASNGAFTCFPANTCSATIDGQISQPRYVLGNTATALLLCPLNAPYPCSASASASAVAVRIGCCAHIGDTQPAMYVQTASPGDAIVASFPAGTLFALAMSPMAVQGWDAWGNVMFQLGYTSAVLTAFRCTSLPRAVPAGDSVCVDPCTTCTTGTYAANGACTGCGAGTFSPSPGLSTCMACAAGSYQNSAAASFCVSCALGTASGNVAYTASACPDCPTGTYAGAAAMTACAACPGGSFANAPRSSTCTACATGSFIAVRAASSCAACAAGSFAMLAGASVCALCASGTFAAGAGASVCGPACAAGRFATAVGAPSAAAAGCQSCDAGTFSAQAGASACALCPVVGASFSQAGASACLPTPSAPCPLAPCPVDMFCS